MPQIVKKDMHPWKIIAPECKVREYFMHDKTLDVAVIRITGRYPAAGFVSGIPVEEGDAISIPKSEKYYFDGDMKITMSFSPAWTETASEVVEG